MKATIVFEQIWEAMHATRPDGTNRYKYIILKGSSRSSKTHSLLQAFYLYAWERGGKRLSVWRDTKKDCKDTVLQDMLKAYRGFPSYPRVFFHKTESRFLFPTESAIEIQGTDDEEKVHGYQGDITWLNEPYKISRDTFDQLDMRTTDFVFVDWNPKKSHWAEDIANDEQAIVLESTFWMNPFCPPNQKKKILSYQPVSRCQAVESKILTHSQAMALEYEDGQLTGAQERELLRCIQNEKQKSADGFKWSVYGLGEKGERPNRIFHWTEVSDQVYHDLDTDEIGGVDWGAVDPWGVLTAKIYDGALYLHERNYRSENEIRAALTKSDPGLLARLQRSDDEEGLLRHVFDSFGLRKNSVILCDTNRPTKIRALRGIGYEYAIAAAKPPGSILDGIDILNSMQVYYTASSKNIKYEQENYSRKEDRYGVVMDDPTDEDNHLMDPARYIAFFARVEGLIRN